MLNNEGFYILVIAGGIMVLIVSLIPTFSHIYSLNKIKAKQVGDGQHGTARWATMAEIKKTYTQVLFTPKLWRQGKNLPDKQGIVTGCISKGKQTIALVDTADVHAIMIGAAGVGKTAYWLYPNIEFACASGVSFLNTDTKGDVFRNYGTIAKECYGYHISVIDLRNPTRSNGNNLLHLVNKYTDLYKAFPDRLDYKAKIEKYAKIISKTIILSGMDAGSLGQNVYFYDSAEGLLTATIMIVAELCAPEERHIVSVYKIIQELLAPSKNKGTKKNQFQELMELLPPDHKAKWFAGAALNSAEQSMSSVISTAMSRLNAFLNSELEQILCFDTEIDAERFCNEKSAVFIILPEEDPSVFFMVSLIIQQMYREILSYADELGGKLKNRVIFYCDEWGTLPKIDSAEMMFSASRSRRMSIVPVIQSFAQLEKNYGKEGAEIIIDNTQLTVFGGFAPNSETAQTLSKSLGNQTVMSGSVSKGKESSESLQMIERPLMTPDELKSMPKGQFIVMKTGAYPMKVQLKLFFDWGIEFLEPYRTEEKAGRKVAYASREKLIESVKKAYEKQPEEIASPENSVPSMEHKGGEEISASELSDGAGAYYFSEVESKPDSQRTDKGFRLESDKAVDGSGKVQDNRIRRDRNTERPVRRHIPESSPEKPIPKPQEALPTDDLSEIAKYAVPENDAENVNDTNLEKKAGDDK